MSLYIMAQSGRRQEVFCLPGEPSRPIIRNRLYFLQSFEYRFSRIYVPSLSAPLDNSTSEAFNSFTQLDLTIDSRNRLKFVGALSGRRDSGHVVHSAASWKGTPASFAAAN